MGIRTAVMGGCPQQGQWSLLQASQICFILATAEWPEMNLVAQIHKRGGKEDMV